MFKNLTKVKVRKISIQKDGKWNVTLFYPKSKNFPSFVFDEEGIKEVEDDLGIKILNSKENEKQN